MKQKTFFIIFKVLSIARNCLRSKSGPLKEYNGKTSVSVHLKQCSHDAMTQYKLLILYIYMYIYIYIYNIYVYNIYIYIYIYI